MLKIIADIAKQTKGKPGVSAQPIWCCSTRAFDVTDQVLQKLDEQMPTLTVNFVAPVLPPVPAPRPRRRQPRRAAAQCPAKPKKK